MLRRVRDARFVLLSRRRTRALHFCCVELLADRQFPRELGASFVTRVDERLRERRGLEREDGRARWVLGRDPRLERGAVAYRSHDERCYTGDRIRAAHAAAALLAELRAPPQLAPRGRKEVAGEPRACGRGRRSNARRATTTIGSFGRCGRVRRREDLR